MGYTQRAKLYRFRNSSWKARGEGSCKLLKHRETGKVRFLHREEKVKKIVANHYVINEPPFCELQENPGNNRFLVWAAHDSAEGAPQNEQLALLFDTSEQAERFKTAFETAKKL